MLFVSPSLKSRTLHQEISEEILKSLRNLRNLMEIFAKSEEISCAVASIRGVFKVNLALPLRDGTKTQYSLPTHSDTHTCYL